MLRLLLILLCLGSCITSAWSAPVSLKELDLMVRMRVPEQEILRDVQSRKLLSPLDAVATEQLRKNGASANLIQQLGTGNFSVSSEEAARVQQLQMESRAAAARAQAQDEAAAARSQSAGQAGVVANTMRNLLEGKLVRMENGSIRPYSAEELRNVRYYALYYSAHWCGPCRKFTPQLVNFYKQFKAQHPEFEVVFISSDYSPQDMAEYMKSTGMPWPAVKHDLADSKLRSLAGSGIPWLGIYDAAGQPVSSNGRDKKWMSPNTVLDAFKEAVARAQQQG